jgi:hypothetical protein
MMRVWGALQDGRTVLHIAAVKGMTEVITVLLAANATLDIQDNVSLSWWQLVFSLYPQTR